LKKNIIFIGGSGLIGSSLINNKNIKKKYNCINFDLKSKNKKNFYLTDASNPDSLSISFGKFIKRFKNLYAVVNCAYPKKSNIKQLPNINQKYFLADINNHFGLYLNVIQVFCNYFIKKKKPGIIINFSSIYGFFLPRFEIYKKTSIQTSSLQYMIIKNAIDSMTRYSAKFFLKNKIRINNISPGGVFKNVSDIKFVKNYTKYTSSKRMIHPTDLANVVDFLLSSNSDKITGQRFIIDDGFTL
jgi:NAD(P)-dependent dehydrogenase (short-subunit alcohol dehydrogenase family)